jgi:hypothetical protein
MHPIGVLIGGLLGLLVMLPAMFFIVTDNFLGTMVSLMFVLAVISCVAYLEFKD